jgi:NADH dehydrogenase [ubiquinone] 1 alpha subcomplex assembly factor 7
MSVLAARMKSRIKAAGPMSVAEYMTLCLLDPVDGYYPTRDPLGSDGDFITAPEISQMFGEVIGLWCLQSWQDLGRPKKINLIELGPGRGIMMSDILRTAALEKDFLSALDVTLIEASAALEAVQARTLAGAASAGVSVSWAKALPRAAEGPLLIIGNEFLDCLPIRQFIQKDSFAGRAGWHERLVALDEEDRLSFGVAPAAISAPDQESLPEGCAEARTDDLLEVCPAARQIIDQISALFAKTAGRALFIDYGPELTEFGDTLQALKRHEKVGVFSDPGNTDLTARVDFAALQEMAASVRLAVTAPTAQREFLSKLGIEMRAVALSKSLMGGGDKSDEDKVAARAKIARQLHRLMDGEEMGELFKAICFQSSGLPLPLGFRKLL